MITCSYLRIISGILATLATVLTTASAYASYIYIDLGISHAHDINNVGQVVGEDGARAVIWENGASRRLSDLGGIAATAQAINELGEISGFSYLPNGRIRGVKWSGSTLTTLQSHGGRSAAYDINDSGQVAGMSATALNAAFLAVVWSGTTRTTLESNSSIAFALNNIGTVVGQSSYSQGRRAAVRWDGGNALSLETLGGVNSYAIDINDLNIIVGVAENEAGTERAVMWRGDSIIELSGLGTGNSYATAVNELNQIVGFSHIGGDTPSLAYSATIWTNDRAIDLNDYLDPLLVGEGWRLMQATGINDNGWIVGRAANDRLGIESRGFMLQYVPDLNVPEPSTIWMLSFGLAALAFVQAANGRRR